MTQLILASCPTLLLKFLKLLSTSYFIQTKKPKTLYCIVSDIMLHTTHAAQPGTGHLF